MTFFVIPMIVAEGAGPFESIGRSTGLFRQTWGRQVTSGFAFGLVYLVALVIVAVPAAGAWMVHPALGIALAVAAGSIALATVAALEGIFKAALYQYAKGESERVIRPHNAVGRVHAKVRHRRGRTSVTRPIDSLHR